VEVWRHGPKNGISLSEPPTRVYERTADCIDDRSNILLVHAGPTGLHDLANFLIRSSKSGGFGCQLALNLDGDASSGMFWREGKKGVTALGEVDALLATAVVISRR
jgi:hypothetical protein